MLNMMAVCSARLASVRSDLPLRWRLGGILELGYSGFRLLRFGGLMLSQSLGIRVSIADAALAAVIGRWTRLTMRGLSNADTLSMFTPNFRYVALLKAECSSHRSIIERGTELTQSSHSDGAKDVHAGTGSRSTLTAMAGCPGHLLSEDDQCSTSHCR